MRLICCWPMTNSAERTWKPFGQAKSHPRPSMRFEADALTCVWATSPRAQDNCDCWYEGCPDHECVYEDTHRYREPDLYQSQDVGAHHGCESTGHDYPCGSDNPSRHSYSSSYPRPVATLTHLFLHASHEKDVVVHPEGNQHDKHEDRHPPGDPRDTKNGGEYQLHNTHGSSVGEQYGQDQIDRCDQGTKQEYQHNHYSQQHKGDHPRHLPIGGFSDIQDEGGWHAGRLLFEMLQPGLQVAEQTGKFKQALLLGLDPGVFLSAFRGKCGQGQ